MMGFQEKPKKGQIPGGSAGVFLPVYLPETQPLAFSLPGSGWQREPGGFKGFWHPGIVSCGTRRCATLPWQAPSPREKGQFYTPS